MRALSAIAAFLLASLGVVGRAAADMSLWTPRASLSLALDWNKVTVGALTVTSAAQTATPLDVVAYKRVEKLVRTVAQPTYMPGPAHRRLFREVRLEPFTPYVGAYGLALDFRTDAILR